MASKGLERMLQLKRTIEHESSKPNVDNDEHLPSLQLQPTIEHGSSRTNSHTDKSLPSCGSIVEYPSTVRHPIFNGSHPPLDTSQNQIRLLHFDWNACKGKAYTETPKDLYLKHAVFNVDDCPTYTALSYTWRSKGDGDYVFLNDQLFHVQRNLADALVALHDYARTNTKFWDPSERRRTLKTDLAKWLWIDALCIDQSNLEERNHQVGLMSQIYSRAACVIVWLGLECEESVRCLANQDIYYEQHLVDQMREKLESFFTSSYWQRAWTVQEFELGNAIYFAAGPSLVPIHATLRDIAILGLTPAEDTLADSGPSIKSKDVYWPVVSRMRQRGRLKGTALKDLILRFRDMCCEDPRDTVYALLGLAAVDDNQLEPDYTLSASDLCSLLPKHGIELWRISSALRDAAKGSGV